jgi:hypothetical protein
MFKSFARRISGLKALPWLTRLVAGLLPRRFKFDPRSAHVRFEVDKVTL